jgi:hypothetical protein
MLPDSYSTKETPVVDEPLLGRLDDIYHRIFEARQRQAETMAWLLKHVAHAAHAVFDTRIANPALKSDISPVRR